jgi:hypothetical protein
MGLCPHDLFTNTKADIGPCSLAHDDKLKRDYEEAAKTHDFGYEDALERALEQFVNDANRRIQKGQERVADEDGSAAAVARIDVDSLPELADISKQIEDKVAASEAAGEAGEVDKSMKLVEEAEALRRTKAEMQVR